MLCELTGPRPAFVCGLGSVIVRGKVVGLAGWAMEGAALGSRAPQL